ncbi:uncharacterized protein LOC125842943 [Solanum stenotomum]|uniref:uncharacterized protein LOC125842943 n=1 Tax=Solanum stenotomum TaxID=172797 RepID=UPI0020D15D02|nr:uncharacterized protein LOC125842943 [Solanum stenotomum]
MGDHVAEFNKILDYKDVLLETNPGNTCVVKLTDSKSENGMKQFHSFYICFDAMKKDFQQGCRRSWTVIGTKSKATWKWFMTILQDDLNVGDDSQITIISDIQKGLIVVVDEVFLECEHRMCARHILANWSQNWRGIERRKKFWACARATFEINNMVESLKVWILGPRNKTIVSMLEEIRIKVMSRVSKSRAFVDTWITKISPMAMMVFNPNVTRSMQCNIEWNGDDGFEVLEGAYKHTVNLDQQKCSCRSWKLKSIPCAHGIAAMNHLNMDASISSWYRKETYLKTYSHFI